MFDGVGNGHAVRVAQHDAADKVDGGDDQASLRVALDELAGAVHRPVEFTFLDNLLPPLLGLFFGDVAGVEVGVDGHLLSGHGVRTIGADFANCVAPLVMTMNWMMRIIMNMTMPTTRLPPATKFPNVLMIVPASPCRRIRRVEATFKARRKSVVNSSREGKVDSSIGSLAARTMTSTAIARDMLHARPMSSRNVGSGMSRVARMPTRPAANMKLLRAASEFVSDSERFRLSAAYNPRFLCLPGLGVLMIDAEDLFDAGEAVVHHNDIGGCEPDVWM